MKRVRKWCDISHFSRKEGSAAFCLGLYRDFLPFFFVFRNFNFKPTSCFVTKKFVKQEEKNKDEDSRYI